MVIIILDVPMIDLTRYKNHIGKCLVSDQECKFWVNIPKNASNSVSYHLLRQKRWYDDNWFNNPKILKYKGIVVLRDPLSRWKGSTLELCYHHIERNQWKTDNFEEWFEKRNFFNFDKNLDLHHVRQVDFLRGLDLDQLTFVYVDDYFEKEICRVLDIASPLKQINIASQNKYKMLIEPYVTQMLENTELLEKIKNFYEDDYSLLSKLMFLK